jgi:hypothetical protein
MDQTRSRAVRHSKRNNAEQAIPADRLPEPPTVPNRNQPWPDWRELGRRVLTEALRRSARELRRRNGCPVRPRGFRGKRRRLS